MNRVKPTEKQAKAMALIKKGVKPCEAMRKAGYAKSTSQAPGRKLVRSTGAKTIIEQQLDAYARVGITPEYLANKTKEWLEAQKVISANVIIKNGEGQIEHMSATARTNDFIEVPDFPTQIKAAEMVRQDMGIAKEQGLINSGGGPIQVIFKRQT